MRDPMSALDAHFSACAGEGVLASLRVPAPSRRSPLEGLALGLSVALALGFWSPAMDVEAARAAARTLAYQRVPLPAAEFGAVMPRNPEWLV